MWPILIILGVLALAVWLIGRRRERELLRRLEQARGDPNLVGAIVDEEVRVTRARAEWWRQHRPRGES